MQENEIEAFVKYNYFHKEQRPRYTPNPFHAESFHYNAEEDYDVCPIGQHMNRIGTKLDKIASGYINDAEGITESRHGKKVAFRRRNQA